MPHGRYWGIRPYNLRSKSTMALIRQQVGGVHGVSGCSRQDDCYDEPPNRSMHVTPSDTSDCLVTFWVGDVTRNSDYETHHNHHPCNVLSGSTH